MEYKYKGINEKGKIISGKIIVENHWSLMEKLKEEEIYCIKYKLMNKESTYLVKRRISEKNLSTFCRNLKNNLKAGIPLVNALKLLEEHLGDKRLCAVLNKVINNIKSGLSFTESLEEFKSVFPEFFITLIHFGEESGRLQQILDFMEKYYMKEFKRRKKIISVSIYPIGLFIFVLIMGIIAIYKLVPAFFNSMDIENMELPYITRFYLGLSKVINSLGILIVPIGIGILIGISFIHMYLKGKGITYNFKYRNPLIKNLEINRFCCKFTMALSMMMGSGIDIKSSLILLRNCEKAIYIKERLNRCIEGLERGDSLYDGLRRCDIFSKYFLSTIYIGEINGSIEEVLQSCNEVFEEELEGKLDRMTSLIEPLLIVFVGIFIGSIILAIMIPVFNMYNTKF
ncbi:type II secretion system F family protein [Clostridium sp.]|uniref:type II secretion system F family protein n=1 Tax=Clostridium sp. TaxID=1506 RepID=UPI003464093E